MNKCILYYIINNTKKLHKSDLNGLINNLQKSLFALVFICTRSSPAIAQTSHSVFHKHKSARNRLLGGKCDLEFIRTQMNSHAL